MFNAVSFVRELCKERGIPIATVEKACGFGNGYLNPKKISTLSYERAVVLANYLNLTAEYLLTGEEEQKERPAQESGPNKDMLLRWIDEMSREELIETLQAVTKKLSEK